MTHDPLPDMHKPRQNPLRILVGLLLKSKADEDCGLHSVPVIKHERDEFCGGPVGADPVEGTDVIIGALINGAYNMVHADLLHYKAVEAGKPSTSDHLNFVNVTGRP